MNRRSHFQPSPWRTAGLLGLALVLLSVPHLAGQQPPPKDGTLKVRPGQVPAIEILPAQPPEPVVPPGPEPDVEILFSSEVKGFYQPCG